jgi:acyl-coenzyme A synthetase/AMP-(fatty) acid ligase
VKTRLAAHEAPREFEFMDEFPSTVTGKIMRRELRAREARKIARSKESRGGSHD